MARLGWPKVVQGNPSLPVLGAPWACLPLFPSCLSLFVLFCFVPFCFVLFCFVLFVLFFVLFCFCFCFCFLCVCVCVTTIHHAGMPDLQRGQLLEDRLLQDRRGDVFALHIVLVGILHHDSLFWRAGQCVQSVHRLRLWADAHRWLHRHDRLDLLRHHPSNDQLPGRFYHEHQSRPELRYAATTFVTNHERGGGGGENFKKFKNLW